MNTGLKTIFVSALLTAGALAAFSADQEGGPAKAPAKGNHFAIAYRGETPSGKVQGVPAVPPKTLQALGEEIAKRLLQQGLVRVPTLDTQCCTVQVTLLDTDARGNELKKTDGSTDVRVIVMDIDNQPLYTKELSNSANGSGKAADQFVNALLADERFLKTFKAH